MENQEKPPEKLRAKPGPKPPIIDYVKVEELAGRGLKKKDIALCIGISPTTFFAIQKNDEEFVAAMARGHAKAVAAVTGKLLGLIQLNNPTAIIFWLKCRADWKETQVIERKEAPPPLPGEDCSPEDAESAYLATMRGTSLEKPEK